MFVKIKNFFIMLGYKLKRFSLWKWFGNLTRKQRILISSITIGAIALIVAAIVLFVTLSGGSSGGGSGAGSGSGSGGEGGGSGGAVSAVEQITGIYISAEPYDLSYYVGDSADWRGLVIGVSGVNIYTPYVSYDKFPEELTVTGFDSSAPKKNQVITVSYKGHTATFTVDILKLPEAKPTLQSIRLDPAPKATCRLGKAPSLKDARIVMVYSDGSEKSKSLTTQDLGAFEDALMAAKVGDTVTIPVIYIEDGAFAETSFTVTIVE